MPDPFAPRPIDQPVEVPLDPGADLSVLDEAKILAAPTLVGDRPAWRAALRRWRAEARDRIGFDPRAYDNTDTAWAATAWNVAMIWLWDEVVWDWDDAALRRGPVAGGVRRARTESVASTPSCSGTPTR